MQKYKQLIGSSLILFLSGCVVIDPLPPIEERGPGGGFPKDPPTEAPVEEKISEPTEATAPEQTVAIATPESVQRPQTAKRSSAAEELRKKARSALADGDFGLAERHMQRALRIAPREAENYAQLATIRLEEDKIGEALQLARKGLTLSPDRRTRSRLEDIIALASQ